MKAPLNDSIIVAVSQLVDDAQSASRRDPSHSDLESEIKRCGLSKGDPKSTGQTVGKAKRVRATLNWALQNNFEQGREFVQALVSLIRGHGGFRETSNNFVGADAVENAISAFASEGYVLTRDGELHAQLLEGLSVGDLTVALEGYVRRAKRGSMDAALVVGTSKDLLEAVAAHVLQQRFGNYSSTTNFPTLLGQAFIALELATPMSPPVASEPPMRQVERAMYDLACAINRLRNKEGTGHGRPWLPSITEVEARTAVESMGIIAERMLDALRNLK
jgi:abortive infection Abi-like protein